MLWGHRSDLVGGGPFGLAPDEWTDEPLSGSIDPDDDRLVACTRAWDSYWRRSVWPCRCAAGRGPQSELGIPFEFLTCGDEAMKPIHVVRERTGVVGPHRNSSAFPPAP